MNITIDSADISCIFFDIGDTLATASITNGGANLSLNVLPGVNSVLTDLKNRSIPLGIISNTPNNFSQEIVDEALDQVNLLDFFQPELLIYSSVVGISKDSVLIFCFAADRAGIPHGRNRCVFVGESSRERKFAKAAGFLVSDSVENIHQLIDRDST